VEVCAEEEMALEAFTLKRISLRTDITAPSTDADWTSGRATHNHAP
jgi:hypothetical protein